MIEKSKQLFETKFRKLLSKIVRKNLHEALLKCQYFHLTDNEELMEFMRLGFADTSVDVDIFIDDSQAYKRNNHPLLIYVRNGYGHSAKEFIPISIANDPQILDPNIEIQLSDADIINIKAFVSLNRDWLKAFANQQITVDEIDFRRDFLPNMRKV